MGCCSSKKGNVSKSVSPTKAPEPNKDIINVERVNSSSDQLQLKQHHGINQQTDEDDDDDIATPHIFKHNRSIYNEMMRLEEYELNNKAIKGSPHNNMEIKSNENSEDLMPRNDQSFASFSNAKSPSKSQSNFHKESYHPFGLVDAEKKGKRKKVQVEEAEEEDPDALYAENLKQHGFDPAKFRMSNISIRGSVLSELDNNGVQNNVSEEAASSFVSSDLSSKSEVVTKAKAKDKKKQMYGDIDIDAFLAEGDKEDEDDALLMEELTRPNSKGYSSVNVNDDNSMQSMGYIDSIKESVKEVQGNDVSHMMTKMSLDDEDENLMDAILSLGLDD